MKHLRFFIFFFSVLGTLNSFANTHSVLKSEICVNFKSKELFDVIDSISILAEFDFSIPEGTVNPSKKITINKCGQIDYILHEIINDRSISFSIKNNHLIFEKKAVSKTITVKSTPVIKGYLRDAETGEPVQRGYVIDSTLQITTSTDSHGFFSLSVPNPEYSLQLHCIADNYKGKLIFLEMSNNNQLNIQLEKLPQPHHIDPIAFKEPSFASIDDRMITKIIVPQKKKNALKKILEEDANDLLIQPLKLGFVPFLSSNLQNDAVAINQLAFNAFIGYSAGVKGIELGSFMNFTRYNVEGLQASGFANNVGGTVDGIQAAGFYNFNGLETKGVQLAGFVNIDGKDFRGVQLAGFFNITRGNHTGVQASGFGNVITEDFKGTQFSGFFNYNSKKFKGTQFAGFTNLNLGDFSGVQGSGFINCSSKKFKGVQLAGFANVNTDELSGMQISGFFNYSKNLRGMQIGIINVADTIEKGLSIGLLSYVKHGYHKIDLQFDYNRTAIVSFKTGVHGLYNILSTGYRISDDVILPIGYGIGSGFYFDKKHIVMMGIDAIVYAGIDLQNTNETTSYFSNLVRIQPYLSVRLYKSLELYSGLSLEYKYDYVYDNIISQAAYHNPTTEEHLDNLLLTYTAGLRF